MFYLILAITFIGFLFNDVAYAGIGRKKSALAVSLYRSIFMSILMVPVLFFINIDDFELNIFLISIVIGMIGAFGFFIQLESYKYLPIGIVVALTRLNNIIIIALAYFVYNETLSTLGYVGATIILASLVILGFTKSEQKHLNKDYGKGIFYVILRILTIATWIFSFAYFAKEIDPFMAAYLSEFTILLGFIPFIAYNYFINKSNSFKEFNSKEIKHLFLITIFPAMGSFGLFYSMTLGKIAIVTLTLSMMGIAVAILSHFMYNEKLRPLQWFLISLSVIGLILINI